MAQGNLPTNLDPDDITIQKIEQENQRTVNFVNQIENTDIPRLETKIENIQDDISNLLNFSGEKMRFIQNNVPSPTKDGMGWFILIQ